MYPKRGGNALHLNPSFQPSDCVYCSPSTAQVVLTNGNVSIGTLLSSADVNFEQTITQTQAWLAAHPAPTPKA